MSSEEKKADGASLAEQPKQEAPSGEAAPSKNALKKAAKEKEKVCLTLGPLYRIITTLFNTHHPNRPRRLLNAKPKKRRKRPNLLLQTFRPTTMATYPPSALYPTRRPVSNASPSPNSLISSRLPPRAAPYMPKKDPHSQKLPLHCAA